MSKESKIVSFPGTAIEDTFDEIDLDSLSNEELIDLKNRLSERFDALQAEEPDDPESPECLKWLNKISDIEDMMDEISEIIE
ncbi:MAG: hypothetical protein IKJ65_03685 [Clostridia bacterium]|nr:hypothetical protein [Clostridia bacterium]